MPGMAFAESASYSTDGNGTYTFDVTDTAELNGLVQSVAANAETIIVNVYGTLTYETDATHNGDYLTSTEGIKSITIVGKSEGAKFVQTGVGVSAMGLPEGGTLSFKDIAIEDTTVYTYENGESAWEFCYAEYAGTVEFDNCRIGGEYGGIMTNGDAKFTNCEIVGEKATEGHGGTEYSVWVNNGSAFFENCTFTGRRALKMHEEYGSDVINVTVTGCSFKDVSEKPGIAIGTVDASTEVIVNDCEFIDCHSANGDAGGVDGVYETDTDTSKFNTNLDDVVFDVYTADELITAMTAINAPIKGDVEINILADIDLTGKTWVTGSVNGYGGAGIYTVNGNDHAITNLTGPLFDSTWAGTAELHINNLTIADSTMTGGADNHGFGAFVGHTEATQVVSLTNCHVDNCELTGADWTGGLIGYAAGYNKQNDGPVFETITIKDCSVENSKITGGGSTGAIIGHATGNVWTKVVIENCVVEKNTITCTDDSDKKAGAVLGTVGVAGAEYAGKQGGVYVDAEVSGNTVTSGTTEINRIYGRFGSGGTLNITGGTYYDCTEAECLDTPDDGTINVVEDATFKDEIPYIDAGVLMDTTATNGEAGICFEAHNLNNVHVKVELYSGNTLLVTKEYNKGTFNGTVTCTFYTVGTSSSWTQTPSPWTAYDNVVPTHAVLYVNGESVAQDDVDFTKEAWVAFPGTKAPAAPSTGGGYVSIEKPEITADAGADYNLSILGTTLTITAKEGYELVDVTLNGVSKGAVTELKGLETGDKVVIVTKAIGAEEPVADETRLVARSQMSKAKGKKAIKVYWFNEDGSELTYDGYEIFRSTKRFKGYGTKPIFETEREAYWNTDIEMGTKYYYKVRGYNEVNGERVYSDWSLKAWRVAE